MLLLYDGDDVDETKLELDSLSLIFTTNMLLQHFSRSVYNEGGGRHSFLSLEYQTSHIDTSQFVELY